MICRGGTLWPPLRSQTCGATEGPLQSLEKFCAKLTQIMNIELKDNSHGPIYAQVREQIRDQINNKKVTSGESLPSPGALAQKLSVDRGEIQRAYFELEHAGLISKQTGKDFLGQPKTTYRVT